MVYTVQMRRVLYLLIPWVLYLLIFNVGLNTSLLTRAVNTWNDGQIQYRSALSLFPFVVHVFGFQIWHRDSNVQWTCKTQRVHTLVNPFALLNKKFHAVWVNGKVDYFHFSFNRPSPIKWTAPQVVIENQKKHAKPTTEDSEPGWSVQLSNVGLSSLKDIWFDTYRLSTVASIQGGFEIQSGKMVRVGPASLKLISGDLTHKGKAIANSINLETLTTLNPFDPNATNLGELGFLDVDLQVSTLIESLNFLGIFLRGFDWIRSDTGLGQFEADVQIRSGKLIHPSKASIAPHDLVLKIYNSRVRGTSSVSWQVSEEEQTRSLLKIDLDNFQAQNDKNKAPHLTGDRLSLEIHSDHTDLVHFFADPAVKVTIPKGNLPNLSLFNAYLPRHSKVRLSGGSAQISANIEASNEGNGHGRVTIKSLKRFKLNAEKVNISGLVNADLSLNNGSLGKLQFNLSGSTVSMSEVFTAEQAQNQNSFWWAVANTTNGVITFASPIKFSGNLALTIKDARPVFALYSIGNEVPDLLESILGYSKIKLSGHLNTNQSITELRNLKLLSDDLQMFGHLRLLDWEKRGVFLAKYGIIAVAFERYNDQSNLILNNAEPWYKEHKKFPPIDLQ